VLCRKEHRLATRLWSFFAYDKPVVVRQKGIHHEKIGKWCFVDGLMKGEAVADMDGGKLQAEMISFC